MLLRPTQHQELQEAKRPILGYVLYESKNVLIAAFLTLKRSDNPSLKLLPGQRDEREEALHDSCSSSVHEWRPH